MKKHEIMKVLFNVPVKYLKNDIILQISNALGEDEIETIKPFDHSQESVTDALDISNQDKEEFKEFLKEMYKKKLRRSEDVEQLILHCKPSWTRLLYISALEHIEQVNRNYQEKDIEIKGSFSSMEEIPDEIKELITKMILKKFKDDRDK